MNEAFLTIVTGSTGNGQERCDPLFCCQFLLDGNACCRSTQVHKEISNSRLPTRHTASFHICMDKEGRKEIFYLTTHSTHFIYGYMVSDIWLRTIPIARKETRCRHIGYSFRLTARYLLYAPSHRHDSTYHGLCYTSRGALAGTRNSSVGLYGQTHLLYTYMT